MYLAGSYENPDSLNCIEVFNTKTQTWKRVPPEKRIFKLRNLDGKIYMTLGVVSGKTGVALNPKESTCEGLGLDRDLDGGSLCMIGNIVYSYCSSGQFEWSYTNVASVRRKLEGLEGLPKFAGYSSVELADYGGKMVVFWDRFVPASGYKEKMIWCAVISLEKHSSQEIWGKVEWFDAVLTVPKSYKFAYAIVATV